MEKRSAQLIKEISMSCGYNDSMSAHFIEIDRAIQFIESHLEDDIDVVSVCSKSAYSNWQFQRMFRAATGDSIGGYIRGRRLSLACQELVNIPSKRIIDIAFQFQFSSQESFSRAFKKRFRLTPKQVRLGRTHILDCYKPTLDNRRLQHISRYVQKKPVLTRVTDRKLVGISTTIDSTLGNEKDVFHHVKSHWKKFNKLRDDIPFSTNYNSYGVISDSSKNLRDEKLNYFSGVLVDSFSSSLYGFKRLELEEKQYAVFQVEGDHQCCQVTADYIYGFWLPQSGYVRDEGYDFEFFAESFNLKTQCTSYYYIPICKLN